MLKKTILILIFFTTSIDGYLQNLIKFQEIKYYSNPVYSPLYSVVNNYLIKLKSDNTGKIIYTIKIDSTQNEALIYEFNISKDDIAQLNNILNENKIVELDHTYDEKYPQNYTLLNELAQITYAKYIPNDSIEARVNSKELRLSVSVKNEYVKLLEIFYAKIKGLVPQDIWDKIRLREKEILK